MNNLNLPLELLKPFVYNKDIPPHFLLKELNDYKHVKIKIELYWGNKELVTAYIRELLLDTRGHARQGFPIGITKVLLHVYNELAPTQPLNHKDFTNE